MGPDDAAGLEAETDVDTLVRQLHRIQQRLHALTSGEVDAVIGPAGQTYLLPNAQTELLSGRQAQRRKVATQTALLDALPARVALLDNSGAIVSVNRSWKAFAASSGGPAADLHVGCNYADFCDHDAGSRTDEAHRMGDGIRAVLRAETDAFDVEYCDGDAAGRRWYRMTVTPVHDGPDGGAVVMHLDISARKEAEGAARENERRYRSIVDVLPDLVFTSQANRITFINAAGVRLLGATDASQLLGRTPLSVFAKDPRPVRRERVARLQDVPAQIGFFEDRMVTVDGRMVDVEVAGSSHRFDGQVVTEIVCRDLTERKRVQEEARQLGERLSSTLEHLSDAFGIVDFEWRLIYANRKAEQMLGMRRDKLLGRVLWERLPGLVDSPFGDALRRARATNAQVDVVAYYEKVRGWFDMRVQPTADGLAMYLRNVTASHDLATAFEAEHARLVAAQSVARLGSWDADLGGNGRVNWSDEMHRIFETDGATWQPDFARVIDRVHPDDRTALSAAMEQSLHASQTRFFEHRISMPDGRIKVVEERWQVFHDDAGAAVRAIGTTQDITERKLAASVLERTNELLDIAGDMAQFGGWSVEIPSMVLSWTPGVYAIYGRPPQYVPTVEAAMDQYADEYRVLGREVFVRCIEDGVPFDVETEVVSMQGLRRWVRVIGKAERNGQGRIVRVHGAFQEITLLKRSEQTSKEHVERLRTTLESITDGFFTLDREFRFDYVNPRAEELLGRRRDTLAGLSIWDAFPAARGSLTQKQFEHAMREQIAVAFEDHYEPLGLWYEANAYPSTQGLAVYFRDITARKRDSEQMKLLETSVQQLNDMVLITNVDFSAGGPTILFVNDAFVRATGYRRDEILGASPSMLHGPMTDMVEIARVRASLARSEILNTQLLYYRKNGDPFWVEIGFVPVVVSGTTFSHLVGVARDVTERKRDQDSLRELNAELEARVASRTAELDRTRRQAEQATEAKSAFLATMSHEIRTPMNGVIGMIDVLHQTSLRGYQVEMVDLIHDSAIVLLQIIEDILDFSKIEAGKLTLEQEPFNLGDTIEKVCRLLDHIAVKLGVRMTVFVDPAIPRMISGDETRIRQILVNLAGNAIKFCSGRPVEGEVSVRAVLVEDRDHGVTIDLIVTDNGIGIDQAAQARLFTPFSQADASTTRRFGGTGLGLAISQMLVHLMDGTISLQSAPDEGARFTVRVRFPEVCAVADQPDDDVDTLVRGLRCAVIGSEQPLADDLDAYLSAAGARVGRFADPAAAAADRSTQQTTVWLVLPTVAPRSAPALRDVANRGGDAQVRFVVFRTGKRRRPRVEAEDFVTLDVDLLFRKTLFRAIALAAGRLQQEIVSGDVRSVPTDVPVPLRSDAIRQGRLVLVAEDNETNRKVVQKQLQLIGFAADLVVNGQQALDRWRSGDFALLLTDLHMPTMDGYALTAAIRAEEQARGLRRTPIIVLTANALRDEERRCLAAGMDAYLTKPVRLAVLKDTIEDWLDSRPPPDSSVGDADRLARDLDPMDLEVLMNLVGDDEEVVAELLQAFRSSAQQCGLDLQKGLATGSLQAVADASHKLKSGARSVGARQLGDLCAAIEDAAQGGRVDVVTGLLANFGPALEAVDRFLESR